MSPSRFELGCQQEVPRDPEAARLLADMRMKDINRAVDLMRERCAKVAEAFQFPAGDYNDSDNPGPEIAARIRGLR